MSQAELAEAAGLSRDMIGRMETGRSGARFPNIERLCAALEIDFGELFSIASNNPVVENPKLQTIMLRLAKMSDTDLDWVNGVLDSVLTRRT